jgi:hypothetical protein
MLPDDTVQVSLTGFKGPGEPRLEQKRARMTKYEFHYMKDGSIELQEDGQTAQP